jgi:hypothetical protein
MSLAAGDIRGNALQSLVKITITSLSDFNQNSKLGNY